MTLSERLRALCSPEAEALGDKDRIDSFVDEGMEAAHEIGRLTARVAELEKAGEWQTMESAPKDGTLIMVCWLGGPYPIISRWLAKSNGWTHPFNVETKDPTHWMPLPAKPGEGAKT